MDLPLVSIIVPNYNHSNYLKQRLDSIFDQNFQDFEVILLDDLSTDNSLTVLNLYKNHPKVSHFIINEVNSGSPFKQWIKGIKLARGEYVWIAESDDFAENSFLEKAVSVLKNNIESNLVYVDSKIVDSDNKLIDLWSVRKNKRFSTQKWASDYEEVGNREVIDYLLYSTTINNASAVLFRKQSLDKAEFLKELSEFRTAGDLFTYINVVLQGRISYIAQPLNNYREHQFNITKKNTKSGLLYNERIRCFNKSLSLFEDSNVLKSEIKELKKSYLHVLKKNGFSLVDYGFSKELNHFIERLVCTNIVSRKEGYGLISLFKVYGLKSEPFKKVTKKLIKKIL